jgi:hypothetical protein
MPDKSSTSEQIKSGFFKFCRFVLGFIVFCLLLGGLSILFYPAAPSHHWLFRLLGGSLSVVVALTIMFITADRWGGFAAGFFFLPGAARALGSFFTGYDYSYPPRPLSRLESGLFALYSIAVIALVWRFIGRRKIAITIVDRLALTTFATCCAVFLVRPQSYVAPALGLVALLIAWVLHRWHYVKEHRRHTRTPVRLRGLTSDPPTGHTES